MTRRRLAAVGMAATVVLSLHAPAAGAGESPVMAAGTMTVKGSAPAYTRLTIPEPVLLSLNYWSENQSGAPRFSAGPDLGAVVLVSEEDPSLIYSAARLPKGASMVQRLVSLGPGVCQVRRHCGVPAGTYRLYLVAEKPLSVTLRLKGLGGASTLTPTTRAVGEIGGPTHSYLHTTPQLGVEVAAHGAGMAASLPGKSNFVFSGFWFRGQSETPLQVGDAGSCFFYDVPPTPEAFAPGCPNGSMGSNHSTFRGANEFAYLEWAFRAGLEAGDYAWGNFAVHTGIRDEGFVGFWLNLD